MIPASWQATGDLFEGCNCELLCPCHISFRNKAQYGICQAVWAAHIEQGQYGEVSLAGLNAFVVGFSPGPTMREGHWTALLYLDDRAAPEQEQALTAIFSGAAGGPWEKITPFFACGTYKAVERATFAFTRDGRVRRLQVADIASLEVEAIPGADGEGEVRLVNLYNSIHGPEHTLSRSTHRLEAQGLQWDNSGKHGLYSRFSWSGP